MLQNGTPQEAAIALDGLDMSDPGFTCPVQRAFCTRPAEGAPDPDASWISQRKAAAIIFYQAQLKS
jgi:hypothetical protein